MVISTSLGETVHFHNTNVKLKTLDDWGQEGGGAWALVMQIFNFIYLFIFMFPSFIWKQL